MKTGLKIVPVASVEEVLVHALARQPKPIDWDEVPVDSAPPVAGEDDAPGLVAH